MTRTLTELRAMVRQAAIEGRATYLPAGARDNGTALVLIDGEPIGQASVLMRDVEPVDGSTYGEVPLRPV